ncbi:MAG: radical SAM protein [Lachnospiraceae bacterium]|nr:radical SAM protein [Lachnospiraceae bacterium]
MKFVNGLSVEVTQKCNSHCRYCFSESSPLTCKEIPFAKLVDVIEQYLTLENKLVYDALENKRLKSQLVITGGEFFLHSQWKKLLEYLTDRSIEFDTATNGILLNDDMIEFLGKTSVNDFQISLDGLKKEENALRNPLYLETIIDNIKKVAESPLRERTTIKATVTKYNINAVSGLVQFCEENGLRLIFGYVQVLGRAAHHHEYILSADEIKEFNINIVENYPKIVLPLMFSHAPCPLDVEEEPLAFRIAANGDIFPCASFHEDFFVIGNIYDCSLQEAINSEKFKKIQAWVKERKNRMISDKCVNCYVADFCQGSCPAASYYEMGDVYAPVRRICDAAKGFNYYMLPKLFKEKVKLTDRR